VHFGFTGATGGAKNLQQVKVTEVNGTYEANHDHLEAFASSEGLTITGSGGNDNIIGGLGDDTLIGGFGSDTLTGGAGRDHFAYRLATEGRDTIKDFDATEDSLSFSASGFGAGLVASQNLLANINFIADANPMPTTNAGTFLFNTETHDLAWDSDGSGASDPAQIAHFETPVSLTVHHFEITA
jgi:Ca2+-binding RTX toxin-like protein